MLIYVNIMKYVSFMNDSCQGGIISFPAINKLGSMNIRCQPKSCNDAYANIVKLCNFFFKLMTHCQ